MIQKLGPNQKTWIVALRSGVFKQRRAGLGYPEGPNCCLGVGCIIAGVTHKGGGYWGSNCDASSSPDELDSWLGIRKNGAHVLGERHYINDASYRSLAMINDKGFTFEEIADYCEANTEKVFMNSM